jgi:hypothetical protein
MHGPRISARLNAAASTTMRIEIAGGEGVPAYQADGSVLW